jgi:hypothetical protein
VIRESGGLDARLAIRAKRGRRAAVWEARPDSKAGPVLGTIASVATTRLLPASSAIAIEASPKALVGSTPCLRRKGSSGGEGLA